MMDEIADFKDYEADKHIGKWIPKKLSNCPFCGEEVSLVNNDTLGGKIIVCSNFACGIYMAGHYYNCRGGREYFTEEELSNKWNKLEFHKKTDDVLIAELTRKQNSLEKENKEYVEILENILSLIYSIGGPLNDNILNYSKKQLHIFSEIVKLIVYGIKKEN